MMKKWWQQKKVWAAILGLIALLGGAFGLTLSPEVRGQIVEYVTTIAESF